MFGTTPPTPLERLRELNPPLPVAPSLLNLPPPLLPVGPPLVGALVGAPVVVRFQP